MAYPRRLRAAPRALPPPPRRKPLASPLGTNWTQAPSDSEGLSDTRVFELSHVVAEAFGLTDALIIDQSKVVTDPLGLSDSSVQTTSAYLAASTLSEFNAASGTVTVPSGVASGNTGLLVVVGATNVSNETPVTVTPSKAGLTFTRVTTTPDFPESDDNMWSDVFRVDGLSATDIGGTISISLSATRLTAAQLFVFDGSFDPASTLGERSGTNADVAAPDMTCVAGQQIIVLALDRSPAGVGYNSVSNNHGRAVTVRSYAEGGTSSGNVSILVADFVETGTTTGTTTVTYNHTSANAQAIHIPVHIDVLDQTQTDNTGLTDTPSVGLGRPVTDSLGLTDSIRFAISQVITDDTGLVDTASVPFDMVITDYAYVTDTDDVESLQVDETIDTETQGLSDTLTFQQTLGQSDTLGLTDALTIDRSTVVPETLGLTDTITPFFVYARSQTDTEGLTDTVTPEVGRAASDTLGLSDSLIVQPFSVLSETLGLSDSIGISITSGADATLTDAFEATDSTVIDRGSVLPVEASGLSDALVIEVVSTFAEVMGLSDALSLAADFQRVLDEEADLTDELSFTGDFNLDEVDFAGLSDSLFITVGLARNITVTAAVLPSRRTAAVLPPSREAAVLP